ncbi:MAG: DJ-1/PfpI family protein [Chloroflexota bacterium]
MLAGIMVTPTRYSPSQSHVFIPIAPGFEEGPVVYCLDQLREAGLAVSLVGISPGLISSLHGLTVRPDLSLEQLPAVRPRQLVIVPGGAQCASTLLADPRLYRFVEATLNSGGYVAAMQAAQPALTSVGLPAPAVAAGFVPQNGLDIAQFVTRLVHLVS